MILRLWMRKNSPKKHTSSFPFRLGFPGQPWPSTRDAAMNHVLSRSDALERSRGERLHRRRTAKVISPSPLLSLEGKSYLDLVMSPESHLSLNRGDRLPAGRDLASRTLHENVSRELSGGKRACGFAPTKHNHISFTEYLG